MDQVRIGIIGLGGMGAHHAKYLHEIDGCKFTAVCDAVPDVVDKTVDTYKVNGFADGEALLDSGLVDAVLIATPHYFHPTYAMAAFERGIHVLVEKPVAVTAKAAQEVNDAYEKALKQHPDLKYAGMFQQRVRSDWRLIKRLIDAGEVGELLRVGWTITDWFRSQAYYDSGGWRATWTGEGGGVLINQCPHNLDLFQWFVGLPSKLFSFVQLGGHHKIEVDDDVSTTMQFANGATGTFTTSTSQEPGINRLEIVGDAGTIVAEKGRPVVFYRNEMGVQKFIDTTPERFGKLSHDAMEIKPGGKDAGHRAITENFIRALREGEDLIAPAVDGIRGLELGNAMLMSGLTGKPVDVPTDRDAFADLLEDLKSKSTFKKETKETTGPVAMGASF